MRSTYKTARRASTAAIALAFIVHGAAYARSADSPPPLPPPAGTVVNVSTEAQLQSAVQRLASNQTIVIAPGTYVLTNSLYVNGTFSNVAIRGATNNRDDVVLVGPGMTRASYGLVPYGIWTGGHVQGITIANLTIRDLYYHPIIFNAGTQSPHVYNVHLLDAGEQFIKSNPDGAGGGVDNGIVEYSMIEYTSSAKDAYTNGVDVHTGANWIIRHNRFRNIVSPPGMLAGPAVLVWNHSHDTLVEGNSFVNCARGIAFGLQEVAPGSDHAGGIIRNNFFFRAGGQSGDVAISVADSPRTQVVNNTVFVSGTYSSPIEYRFPETTGGVIANNITDGVISARDGATATLRTNLEGARAELFVDAANGDLHLAAASASAIDRGTTLSNVTDDWDGEIRPQGPGYDIGADERGATAASYAISGHVTDGSTGAPLANATLTLSGARSAITTTNAAGAYAFSGLAGGVDYTVTPSGSTYSFSPDSDFYAALNASQPQTDFRGYAATPNKPPTVSLSAAGAPFNAPATVVCSATASDSDGTVSRVDFYAGSSLIGTDVSAPYSVNWNNVAAGTYTLTALATDNSGATTQSSPVTVTVNATANPPAPGGSPTAPGNQPPTVTLTSPVDGATFNSFSSVSISASVHDSDGRIRRVRFFAGRTQVGDDTRGPAYTTRWSHVAPGTYTLTAVATDDDGASTTSGAVTITVNARRR